MSSLAIVNPTSLLGAELRERLEQRPELCSKLRLLSSATEDVGLLTEIQGEAALVQPLDADALNDVDLVFVCGDSVAVQRTLQELPDELPTVVVSAIDEADLTVRRVAGMGEATTARQLGNPHPAVISLVWLLDAVDPLAASAAKATVILPASVHDQPGLDELFAQTRAIIAFSGERTEEVFGHQLAFNILPASGAAAATAQLQSIRGESPPVSIHLLQGGIFHGLSISMAITFDQDPGAEELRRVLAEHPRLELVAEGETLGPIDGAAATEILVGELSPGEPGSYWIWAIADNLTSGGALNAIGLAEELLAG